MSSEIKKERVQVFGPGVRILKSVKYCGSKWQFGGNFPTRADVCHNKLPTRNSTIGLYVRYVRSNVDGRAL